MNGRNVVIASLVLFIYQRLKAQYERSRIMINNTALSAKIGHVQFAEQIAKNVTFIDEEYKKFFLKYLKSEDI